MRSVITTHRPVTGARPPEATDSPLGGQRAKGAWGYWHRRLLDVVRHATAPRHTSLRNLSGRELADIGVDSSEIASIEAEARGRTTATRLRIVAGSLHG